MTLSPGDRIRYECTGDDGLPLVRYGFVGGVAGSEGPVVVMLDGELGGDVVNLAEVKAVTVTTVELCLIGCDLVDEPELRRGLVALWMGEADTAGLDIDSLHALGDGRCDEPGHWCLAELHSGGQRYVLRADALPHDPDVVRVRRRVDAVTTARTPGWHPLLIAAASVGVANSVVFTLLSDLQDKYGFSDAGLGLIAGTGFLVGLLGQLVFAPFADRGHSKRLLLIGLGLAVLGSICFAFSTTLLTLIASRAVVGLSNSLFQPASRAVTIAIGDDDMAHRLGTLSALELAGFVTGPVIGGALVDPFGLKVPFLVAGSFALAGAVMLATRTLPEPPIDTERRLAFDLLRLPRIRAGVLASVALFVPVGFYDATLDRYLTDMGASNTLISFAFLAFGIPFALLASRGGRLADRVGPLRAAMVASVFLVPITVGYGFVSVPLLVVVLSAVEGVVQALGAPAAQAVVAAGAPAGRAAAAQGLAGSGSLVVGVAAAYMAGALYENIGARGMFAIAGTGIALFMLMAVAQGRSPRHREVS